MRVAPLKARYVWDGWDLRPLGKNPYQKRTVDGFVLSVQWIRSDSHWEKSWRQQLDRSLAKVTKGNAKAKVLDSFPEAVKIIYFLQHNGNRKKSTTVREEVYVVYPQLEQNLFYSNSLMLLCCSTTVLKRTGICGVPTIRGSLVDTDISLRVGQPQDHANIFPTRGKQQKR